MKLAAAPIFLFIYALPVVPLLGAWSGYRANTSGNHRLVTPTLVGATISFLWIYSACFTQVLAGPAYSITREVILVGNFFGILIIGVLAFFAKPRMQIWTAIAAVTTAFLWLITIAANSVA